MKLLKRLSVLAVAAALLLAAHAGHLEDGVAALGYKMKQQEKPVFKGNEQRGYI